VTHWFALFCLVVWLAGFGLTVTHVDISGTMLQRAGAVLYLLVAWPYIAFMMGRDVP
jgi:hypothetical protein